MKQAVSEGRRFRIATKRSLVRLAILGMLLALALLWCWWMMLRMPGETFAGPLRPLTPAQAVLAAELRIYVETLAADIGYRSTFHPRQLAGSAAFLKSELDSFGYRVVDHSFPSRGSPAPNLEAELRGTTLPDEIVIVGAHFDSYQGTPGADDNASGVAGVLALAKAFAARPQNRTIRFVLFPNEEPPAFQQADMGSLVYAKACRAAGDNIVAMLSLEMLGYYKNDPGSQKYPFPMGLLFSNRANFIGFAGNVSNRALVKRCIGVFRESTDFPSEGAALPEGIPGIGWSDHWAFWQVGYPAIMITDTAHFRNPNYHTASDKPDTLDYERMARVIEGIAQVVRELAK
ncbi:MAG: M28 family peptidase [Phycisphaeraceae bacterium]|nr:M28 family peptidase [Phycisphaeraceae bacterium]